MVKRTKFLAEVLTWPDAPRNAHVVTGRIKEVAREATYDSVFDLVTARSFGPPAVVAECGVRFLKIGGVLVVSEPPEDDDSGRWNPQMIDQLGLKDEGRVRNQAAYRVLRKIRDTPEQYPRGIGIPKKRPLF